MNRQVRLDGQEGGDDEENFDYSNFNPDDMLTNKQNSEFSQKTNFTLPPDEDFLYNNTLWPENSKLYGHGYEIISIGVSHDGNLIASGGKSQSEKHSKLFLWDSLKNSLLKKLDGHVLTIVQIEFSYDDNYILSVSRDRSLCLFEKINTENNKGIDYQLVQIEKETHARIIWGCSWAKDSKIFLTGSRDNTLKIWKKNNDNKLFKEIYFHEFSQAVTSINLIDEKLSNNYVAFVGLESGEILLVKIFIDDDDKVEFKILEKFPDFISHGLTVKRIKSFRNGHIVKVATCSEDHSVRIFDISVEYLENLLK